jgi:hypothetical protein
MASAAGTKNKKERDLQYKINQIETSLLTLFSGNVRGQIKVNDKIIDMRDSKRNTYEDGFYMITLNGTDDEECHAVLIYKETILDETGSQRIRFGIYDSNGQNWGAKYQYETKIRSSLTFVVDYSMSPTRSINEESKCAVWCIIVIILWNTFRQQDRLTALNIFNTKMRESGEIRHTFLHSVLQLISDCRDFSSKPNIRQFVQDVNRLICNLSVELPCDI